MDTAHALLDPEHQFVGCLLCLPTRTARRLLAGMRDDDLDDPVAAHVLQLVIELVTAGHTPAPVSVLAHAVTTGRAGGEHQHARLGMWLADVYGATTTPAVAGHLKAVVLETAWRRAVGEHAARLTHAVAESPTEVLADLVDDTARIDDLWTRYQTATDARSDVAVVRIEEAA